MQQHTLKSTKGKQPTVSCVLSWNFFILTDNCCHDACSRTKNCNQRCWCLTHSLLLQERVADAMKAKSFARELRVIFRKDGRYWDCIFSTKDSAWTETSERMNATVFNHKKARIILQRTANKLNMHSTANKLFFYCITTVDRLCCKLHSHKCAWMWSFPHSKCDLSSSCCKIHDNTHPNTRYQQQFK